MMFAATAITTIITSTKIMLLIVFVLRTIGYFIASARICQDYE